MFEKMAIQTVQEANAAGHEADAMAFHAAGKHLIASASMEKAAAAHRVNGDHAKAQAANDQAYNLRRYGKLNGEDRRQSGY